MSYIQMKLQGEVRTPIVIVRLIIFVKNLRWL